MSDRQAELEKEVAKLSLELARVRRLIFFGIIWVNVLLALAFTAPQLIFTVFAIGFLIWDNFSSQRH